MRFQLEPTRPPWRSTTDAAAAERAWKEMVGNRLRLTIIARPPAGKPWVVPNVIDVEKPEAV